MKPKGFTLVELLIVIVIVTILASLAIPRYIGMVEKVRARESITNLEIIYGAEKIYKLENGRFTTDSPIDGISDINTALDLEIEADFWSYKVVSAGGGETYDATATRDGSAPPGYANETIIINQVGVWSGDSDFVPSN